MIYKILQDKQKNGDKPKKKNIEDLFDMDEIDDQLADK